MSQDFDGALGRARNHLQRAFLEGLAAATALVEAASAMRQDPGADGGRVGEIARGLDRAVRELRTAGRLDLPPAVLEPLEQALDAEIARWEARSKRDANARPVLRAFLGLRELLFEITRANPAKTAAAAPEDGEPAAATTGAPTTPPTDEPAAPSPRAPASTPRVQRFEVED